MSITPKAAQKLLQHYDDASVVTTVTGVEFKDLGCGHVLLRMTTEMDNGNLLVQGEALDVLSSEFPDVTELVGRRVRMVPAFLEVLPND